MTQKPTLKCVLRLECWFKALLKDLKRTVDSSYLQIMDTLVKKRTPLGYIFSRFLNSKYFLMLGIIGLQSAQIARPT